MTNGDAFALLDEAERLLPPTGAGLPEQHDCNRLEEIALRLHREAPVPRALIAERANLVRTCARSWTLLTFTPHLGYQEREKDLVRGELRHLRSVLRSHLMHSGSYPDQRNGIVGAFWNWLQR